MKVLAIALNTFREAIRNKILYSILLFACVVVAISSLLGSVTIGGRINVVKDFGLFALSISGALITIISGVSLLNKELKQKTIYNILSKPVSRWQFVLGKQLGLTVTVCLMVAIMGAGLMAFVASIEGQIDWLLAEAIFFVMLEVVIISAITIFFSSVVITTTLSGLFTLAFYIAGRSIGYFNFFFSGQEQYSAGVKNVIRVLDTILPDLSLFNVNDLIVYGQSIGIDQALRATAYSFSYSAILLILASFIFNKRELN
jgi:ABC-type transport system involved in multi-copper enzyme maturation permease subunit